MYVELTASYGGYMWSIKFSPPTQVSGQGNGADMCIWSLVSTPNMSYLQVEYFGATFKYCISKENFQQVGYGFVDYLTIVQVYSSPDTSISAAMAIYQAEIDLYAGLENSAGGQVIPEKGNNRWYLIGFV